MSRKSIIIAAAFWIAALFIGSGVCAQASPVPFRPAWNPIWREPALYIDLNEFTGEAESSQTPRQGKERYDEGIALFNEEKYYSAWEAFTESQYADWEEWAAKCPQEKPETGEIWHDSSRQEQITELLIRVKQSSSDMILHIYEDDRIISKIYAAGRAEISVRLPGDAAYTIKNGVGTTWYGEKEAFGKSGTYQTLMLDRSGSESMYLKAGLSYTLDITLTENIDNREEWNEFRD